MGDINKEILAAQEKFGILLSEQLSRVEKMKEDKFEKRNSKCGKTEMMCGGSGVTELRRQTTDR